MDNKLNKLEQRIVSELESPFRNNKAGINKLMSLAYDYGHADGEIDYYVDDLIELINSFADNY